MKISMKNNTGKDVRIMGIGVVPNGKSIDVSDKVAMDFKDAKGWKVDLPDRLKQKKKQEKKSK